MHYFCIVFQSSLLYKSLTGIQRHLRMALKLIWEVSMKLRLFVAGSLAFMAMPFSYADKRVQRTFRFDSTQELNVANYKYYQLNLKHAKTARKITAESVETLHHEAPLHFENEKAIAYCQSEPGYDQGVHFKTCPVSATPEMAGEHFLMSLQGQPQKIHYSEFTETGTRPFDLRTEQSQHYTHTELSFHELIQFRFPSEVFFEITCEGNETPVMQSYLRDPVRISQAYADRLGVTDYSNEGTTFKGGNWEQLSQDGLFLAVLQGLMKSDGVASVEQGWLGKLRDRLLY